MPTGTIGSNDATGNGSSGAVDEPESRSILAGLFRRAPLIVACTLLTAGAALVFSLAQTKQYTADASLLFRDPGFDQLLFRSDRTYVDPTRESATNLSLVSLDAVAVRTAANLGGGITEEQVSDKVSAESSSQSDVVSIKATDPDPGFAATLANAFAENYIAFRRDADRRKVQQARALVTADFNRLSPAEQQGSEGQSLQRQISRLSTLEALQTGNAELVQRAAVPTSPSSPKTVRNTVVAWILGLILGLGIAATLNRHDRRLRTSKDFEEAFDLPVLAEVPESKALARSGQSMGALLTTEQNAFEMLRARLRYFNVDRNINSVLVTSAAPEEGKTTVAWNLGASAASAGLEAIVVEADFHRPTFAARIGTRPRPGLSELLSGQSSLAETVQRVPVENHKNGNEGLRTLGVIVAGSHPPNPVELLESAGMAELIERLRFENQLVVIDSPPLPIVPDAIPLVNLVNGVLAVGRINKTSRGEAQALHDQLRSLKAPTLGVVANRTSRGRGYHGYYRYGRRAREEAAEQTPLEPGVLHSE